MTATSVVHEASAMPGFRVSLKPSVGWSDSPVRKQIPEPGVADQKFEPYPPPSKSQETATGGTIHDLASCPADAARNSGFDKRAEPGSVHIECISTASKKRVVQTTLCAVGDVWG